MSKKENNQNANMMPGNLGMIRDILMGPQMVKVEERFNSLLEKVTHLEKELNNKIILLDEKSHQLHSLEKEVDTQFSALEKKLESSIEKLEDSIVKVDTASKNKLGKMLTDIGQKLMDSK